jgi:uncharacterized protein (TIGR02001 family)
MRDSMYHRLRLPRPGPLALATAMAIAAASGAPAQAQALDTTVNIGASSAWVVRGITLSRDDTVSTFASVSVYSSDGWSLGGLVGRLDAVTGETATATNLFGGYEWSFDGRWTVMTQVRHLNYPDGDPFLKTWCYNEAGASIADADRWILSWSAETRRGPGCNDHSGPVINSRAVEFNAQWPLDAGFHLGGGLGRRMYGGGGGYLFGQVGGGWRHGPFSVLLDRLWLSSDARVFYSGLARERWMASVVWKF